MEIKRVYIGGNREEIDKETGEHRPNLIDTVKRTDLIFTPEQLLEDFFYGTSQEYMNWLMKNKLHPSQINYHDINQKHLLIKRLKVYTMRLLEEAKTDSLFPTELGNMVLSKWLDRFDILENHVYDLSDFTQVEFIKISDEFKQKFKTNSPFAFLTVDNVNQQLKVLSSHKVLLLADKKLPMGKKRGTPIGQTPEKFYQNFFTTIGYKGKGELTEGLNYNRTSFKNFNFNVNKETRLLNDIIYDRLSYDRITVQLAFIFGVYGKKHYFESDIKGTVRTEEELEALRIVEDVPSLIKKELHKERQGSIAVDKTTLEVEKRIPHPKIELEERSEKFTLVKSNQEDILKDNDEESSLDYYSKALKDFEKEIFIKQQGYAELAKEKINKALDSRVQYIDEFYAFLKKGMSVSDALNKFSERYANNPYIKGIIETSITGELQLQSLKDKGIKELTSALNILKNEKQNLHKELDKKETEIATLNQRIESLVVTHTKQLEEIEVNIHKIIEDRTVLANKSSKQSEMIIELEKLIIEYEQTLKEKDNLLKNLKERVLVNSDIEIDALKNEIKYYVRQIEQLKEENKLTLSTTNLLRISNNQLESQLAILEAKVTKHKNIKDTK